MTAKQSEEKASSKQLTPDQMNMLQKLQAQPKTKIIIPKDPLNPKDRVAVVGINGVIYAIPRGKQFEVPESIAKVFMKSFDKTQAAYEKIAITELGADDRDIEIRR